MKRIIKTFGTVFILISVLIVFIQLSFSQELSPTEEEVPLSIQSEVPPPESEESGTLWLWGEVVSLDAASGQILVKYLDYETDSEKEITINVDDRTTYENVKSIGEIKPKDTVSIDYRVNPEAKNIAKNISVEKLETIPTEVTLPSESESTAPSEPQAP